MRLVGTGKAPQGYMEGQVFDVGTQAEADELVARGWAVVQDPADDAARTVVQIANAMVRGDSLTDPYDRAVAIEIGSHDNALAIVHAEDGSATPADYLAIVERASNYDAVGEPISQGQKDVQLSEAARYASQGQNWDPGGDVPAAEAATEEKKITAKDLAAEIEAGDHDENLDELGSDDRKTVQDAVEARKSALEEAAGGDGS